MRQDRGRSMNHHAGVEAAFADLVLPNRFTSLGLDRMDHAVAGSLNQQARAVDVHNDGRGISRIVGPATGRAYPDRFARFLIESHEAVGAASVLTPGERHATDNYQVTVD